MTHAEPEDPTEILSTPARIAQTVAEWRKAIAAFVVPVIVGLGAALADGTIEPGEWLVVVLIALGTPAAVGVVRNGPK